MQFRFISLTAIFLIAIFTFPVFADKAPIEFPSAFPPVIGKTWRSVGVSKTINPADSAQLPQAEIFREYGLKSAAVQTYANGKDKITVEAFRFKVPAGAYGLWSFFQPTDAATKTEFYTGALFIRLLSENAESRKQFAEDLKQFLATSKSADDEFADAALPVLPDYLPEKDKIAGTEKYLMGSNAIAQIPAISDLKDAVDFTGGTQVALAEYNHAGGKMTVLIVEYQTPQFATDGAAKLQQQFDSLSPEAKQKRLVRRVGNYVAEAINISDAKIAEEVLKEMKYAKKIYWEGKNISAVPMEYRPPDEWVVNETIQTGKFIAATFYGISILGIATVGIGLFSGAAYFYWRRSKRRKLGLENAFGDGSGMTRLNLDDEWLGLPENSKKLLGKGE